MSEPTYGAVSAQLRANGYEPVSIPKFYLRAAWPSEPHEISEDAAGIELWPEAGRGVCALVVVTQDPARRAQIVSALKQRKLDRGPLRVTSDGAQWRVFRCEATNPPRVSDLSDGAMLLECATALGMGRGIRSAVLPLSGVWPGESLLTTPRAKLPSVDQETLATMFAELAPPVHHEPIVLPPLRHEPTEHEREIARYRKDPEALRRRLHELTGNPAVQQLLLKEVRGELG